MAMNMDAMLKIRAVVDGQNNIVALSRGLGSVANTAKDASSALGGLRGTISSAIGLVGGVTIFTKIFGDTATLQQQTRSLEVLVGSATKAAEIVKQLQSYGSVTPFEATDLIETAKRLGAFGVESSQVVTVTKRLGDVAGATGANLGELAVVYGQVVAKGRLQTEELLQFQERGVGLQGELQKMYKLSGQELSKAITAGKISAQAVEEAFRRLTDQGGKYANGAIAQSDTLNGKLSTLRDSFTALSQSIGTSIAPALSGAMDMATAAINTFNQLPDPIKATAVSAAGLMLVMKPLSGSLESIGKLAGTVANGMEILRYQTALAGGVMPMLIGYMKGLGAAILAIPGWGWVLAGVTALGLLGKALYDNNEGFRSWVNNVGKIIATDFTNNMKRVADLGRAAAQAVGNAWQQLVGATSSAANAIGNAFSGPFGFIANAARSAFGEVQRAIAALWNALPAPIRKALGQAGKMAVNVATSGPIGYLAGVGVRAFQMGSQSTNNRASKDEAGPNASLNGFSPDLGALGGDSGSKGGAKAAADRAKQIREGLVASKSALDQAKAELAILREADPIKKIQLEYAEKRRVVTAAEAAELSRALSIEQEANIQRRANIELKKLDIQEKKELADAYKELGDKAYEAALKTTQWGSAAEAANTAMAGFRDGISSYLESIGTLGEGISNLTQNAFKGMEDAIVSLTMTGTFNFRQFALSIIEETSRMVTRLLILAPILQAIQSLLPGGGFLSGAKALSPGKLFPTGIFANGAAFDRSGLQAFAMGGVVNRPTIFPFANGGAGRLGLMGEAGPEAIIPLRRGADGKLGVAGGGGTSVTVNVDAKGTSVQGNSGQGEQLGRVISQAVQAELVKQRRPGGLLAA